MPRQVTPPGKRIVAFMDIGTNSMRLLLVQLNPNHSYHILSEQKEVVRLGEGEFIQGRLQPEAIRRTALVCRKFAEMARARGAGEIVAVATSATREAENQAVFLRRLKRESRVDVHVISGHEEARLIYAGVASGMHLDKQQALFVDIGGGSTEVIVGTQRQYRYLESLSLGAIRLSTLFLAGDTGPVSPDVYAVIQRHIRHVAVRPIERLRKEKIDLAVGSSGTIMNLAEIAARALHKRKRRPDEPLTRSDLRKVVKLLCDLPLEERREAPGINPERADIIIGGAAILETLMQDLNLDEIAISDRGLREGLLVDYLARTHHLPDAPDMSLREQSVLRLGRMCSFDEAHARRTAQLALELFDSGGKAGLHDLGGAERDLLYYTALLHDVGSFLSYENHHRHAYYLIRNADLVGFDQSEIGIMAAAALFHRKALPSKKHVEFQALDKPSKKAVQTLGLLLRLAESLDRTHAGNVSHARLLAEDARSVTLQAVSAKDPQLELWGAENQAQAVQRTWKRKLKVVPVKAL